VWYGILIQWNQGDIEMSKKEKPLPKPPNTPFGRKRPFEGVEKKEPLIADEMTEAMAEGKLDQYLKNKLPDSEHARKLAEMMMGMTGMLPPEDLSTNLEKDKTAPTQSSEKNTSKNPEPVSHPPEDVMHAVQSGDVKGLIELLEREQKKRSVKSIPQKKEKKSRSKNQPTPTIEKEIADQLIKIASDHSLSIDWVFLRALKRYVEEYKKTGNL
jgi:hypothetical protein